MSESPPLPEKRTRRHWILASGLGLVALLAAALVWLLASHGGTVTLARLAGSMTDGRLQIEVTEGRLLGPLRLGRLQYSDSTTAIAVRDLYLDWAPGALPPAGKWKLRPDRRIGRSDKYAIDRSAPRAANAAAFAYRVCTTHCHRRP